MIINAIHRLFLSLLLVTTTVHGASNLRAASDEKKSLAAGGDQDEDPTMKNNIDNVSRRLLSPSDFCRRVNCNEVVLMAYHFPLFLRGQGNQRTVDMAGRPDIYERWQIIQDGDKVRIKNKQWNKYLSGRNGGEGWDVWMEGAVGAYERWTVEDHGGGYAFKSYHGRYLQARSGGDARTESNKGSWEMFAVHTYTYARTVYLSAKTLKYDYQKQEGFDQCWKFRNYNNYEWCMEVYDAPSNMRDTDFPNPIMKNHGVKSLFGQENGRCLQSRIVRKPGHSPSSGHCKDRGCEFNADDHDGSVVHNNKRFYMFRC